MAIRQLARQSGDVQRTFAPGHLARLAGGFAGAGGVDHLGDHLLGVLGALVQIGGEMAAQFLLHGRLHLAGDQLVLRLRGELRIRHLDRDHRRQPLPSVVAGGGNLGLLGQAFAFDVAVQGACQGGTKTSQMRAAVALRNVVGVGEDLLLETIVPLHRHLDDDVVAAGLVEVEGAVQRRLVAVQIVHEGAQSALVHKALFLADALVLQLNGNASVQKRQLAELASQRVVLELDAGEGLRGRLEIALRATRFGLADNRQRTVGFAVAIGLLVDVVVAAHGEPEDLRKGVDHRSADAVQPAGNLVGTAIELAAGVQRGEDDFRRRLALFVVNVHRHAAAVVAHRDRFARMDDHVDLVAVAAQGLVDGIVHQLLNHVVQTGAVVGIADVHARSLAHGVQAAQHLDAPRVVSG